jgi:hypothetical protein
MPLKYVSHHENITPDFVSGDPLGWCIEKHNRTTEKTSFVTERHSFQQLKLKNIEYNLKNLTHGFAISIIQTIRHLQGDVKVHTTHENNRGQMEITKDTNRGESWRRSDEPSSTQEICSQTKLTYVGLCSELVRRYAYSVNDLHFSEIYSDEKCLKLYAGESLRM